MAEQHSGHWLSHVKRPLALADSLGRGSPSHVPYVLLCVCFLCFPPVKKVKGQAKCLCLNELNYNERLKLCQS